MSERKVPGTLLKREWYGADTIQGSEAPFTLWKHAQLSEEEVECLRMCLAGWIEANGDPEGDLKALRAKLRGMR